MAVMTDDIEWRVNGPAPVAGTYHGKDEVLAFMPPHDGPIRLDVKR